MNVATSFVLVTPVKDEVLTIGKTIESVVCQTILPREWVIVSDGSIDGTNELIRVAMRSHSWIRLMELPSRPGRDFAAVVHNTEAGIRGLHTTDYDFLGLLDADVTFQADYFEQVIRRFAEKPGLGLAGGVVVDIGQSSARLPHNREEVPGAVQFFRRECFQQLGGLIPIPEGGWDGLTCVQARMAGYDTLLIVDLVVNHHKPRNISQGGVVRRNWQLGLRDYARGCHPIYELVKCVKRVTEPPFLIGAVAWSLGYSAAAIQRRRRVVPPGLVMHLRHEQMRNLRRAVGF